MWLFVLRRTETDGNRLLPRSRAHIIGSQDTTPRGATQSSLAILSRLRLDGGGHGVRWCRLSGAACPPDAAGDYFAPPTMQRGTPRQPRPGSASAGRVLRLISRFGHPTATPMKVRARKVTNVEIASDWLQRLSCSRPFSVSRSLRFTQQIQASWD